MKGFSELIVVLLAAGTVQSAEAADSPGQTFARKAAVDNMAEVELANVARKQASQDSVRQYAERLHQDHQQANKKLQAVAQQKGISLPTDIDAKHKRERDKLAEKQGVDFDADYLEAMIAEHRKDIKEFEKEAKEGKDPELKAYAAQTLPTLREHLKQAEQLQASSKKAAKKSKSPT
jgi:putative membrane protein